MFEAKNGVEGLEMFRTYDIHLGILDIMMPFMDGISLLRKLREESMIPVILLTARAEEYDKVIGLQMGADDYLVKPFSMTELMARVAANIRRSTVYSQLGKAENILCCGDIELNIPACYVKKGGIEISLNAKEFLLLKYFMEHPDHVFTKKQLYQAVWDEDYLYDDNTVMVHISRLRNKIESNPQLPEYIITVKGIGYRFRKRNE